MSWPHLDSESARTTTTILSLPDEVIIEILTNCSVETVLHVERTCKSLYQICQARLLWNAYLHRLDVEQAPSLNPFQALETIPTPDLRKKVINAIRRCHSWRNPNTSWSQDMHVVDLPIHRSPGDQDIIVEPRLLPGGKEVLVLNCGRIELWSLVTKERLWELRSPIGRSSCAGFDFDVVDGGNVVVIAILFEDFETTAMSPLRVYRIDLRNKTVEILLERTLPPVFLFRMMLRGEYFIACIPRTFQTIVINWKAGEALLLDFVDSTGARIDPRCTVLADASLIAFVNLEETGFSAIQVPLSSLSDRWSKAIDHASWTHVSICPWRDESTVLPLPYPGQQERVVNRNDGFGPWILAYRVFRPIWKKEGEKAPMEIFIAAYDCGPGGQTPTRDSDSDKDKDRPSLKLIASSCAQASQLPWNSRSLSNSGRMFSLRSKLKCFSLFTDALQPLGDVPLEKKVVPCADDVEPVISAVEPWSGAIVVGMPGMVKVVTFE